MEMDNPLAFVLLLLALLWPLAFMVAFSPVNDVYMNAEDTPASLTACVTVPFKTSKLETINTIFFPFCHGRLSVLILTSFIILPKTHPQEGFSDEPHSGIDPFLHVSREYLFRLACHCVFPLLWFSGGPGASVPLRVKGVFLPPPPLPPDLPPTTPYGRCSSPKLG